MVITKEILQKLGFDNNHPEYALTKWHKHSTEKPDWNATLETAYITGSNELAYQVSAWKCNEKNHITKRAQVGFIKTTEELNKILELCEMDWTIDESTL